MQNIIIGTSGHIDHGKTTLIKALTGRETDRLKEEKERSISIELGFTYFDLPSGRRAGIIDVPGHEKFIRHMLAGAGGMDMVMLVIAADEGVMPQTKEHLDILSILNIKKGLIVITKASLVEEEWLELIIEDAKDKTRGTFLEGGKVIAVDSITGMGISELIKNIDSLTQEIEVRDQNAPARLPIDRVFSIVGFGTVVTGTLLSGTVNVGDTLEILPQGAKVRIRTLQVHNKSVETAYAGQRVAVNLANIKLEDIERGHVLVQLDSMEATNMVDARMKTLGSISRIITNRERVRLYHGSTEIFARLVLLDQEELAGGEEAYIQLRLEEAMAVKRGDRMVVRFYSPLETIGGAIVIDSKPAKHKRFDNKVIEEIKIKDRGTPEQILEKHIENHSRKFPRLDFFAKLTGQQIENIKDIVNKLEQESNIINLNDDIILHSAYYTKLKDQSEFTLGKYHKNNPLRLGMAKEEFKNKLLPNIDGKSGDLLLELLEKDGIIRNLGKYISLWNFKVEFNPTQLKIKGLLEDTYLKEPYATPKLEDVIQDFSYDKEMVAQVIEIMLGNELIKVSNDIILHEQSYSRAKTKLEKYIKENGGISLAEFRDLLNTSRKYAIAILEHFDSIKFTKRLEDERILF